jgi:hypothetical protein
MNMKKILIVLLATLALAAKASAAPIYGYVQISTGTNITPTLQTGAMNVSSGTIRNFTATSSTMTSLTVGSINGSSTIGDITGVTAGYGLTGGGTVGTVQLNLDGATTSYIQNRDSLQTGTTFYVSSGTASSFNVDRATVTTSLSMNSQRVVNVANGVLSADAANYGQLQQLARSTQTVNSASFSTSANTFQSTNLSGSIIPSATTSRVQITVTGTMRVAAATGANAFLSVFRGNTNLATGGNTSFVTILSQAAQINKSLAHVSFIDSPLTAGATTYTVKIKNDDSATAVGFGTDSDTVMILQEVR